MIANIAIIVTGGAVRLTGSGLGCPTWPRCTSDSLVPKSALGIHGLIEFGNRQLTFVLSVVAIATLVASWRQRRERPLAVAALLGIPAQAILGGITVLTDLNPWTVAGHLLVSMTIVAITLLLWTRLSGRGPVLVPGIPGIVVWVSRALAALAFAVLALGTVVTGAGPHAGDDRPANRIAIDVQNIAQAHADAVMLLIGLSVGMAVLAYATNLPASVRHAAVGLVAIECAQAVLGFVQYFAAVPPLLVALHMLGAALVWVAALRLLYATDPKFFTRAG